MCYNLKKQISDKGKPVEKQGRKATGLRSEILARVVELPGRNRL